MVVVVNAEVSVDKIDIFHKISSLRDLKRAEQTLYASWTNVGQKIPRFVNATFYTSDPVDIKRLVHK